MAEGDGLLEINLTTDELFIRECALLFTIPRLVFFVTHSTPVSGYIPLSGHRNGAVVLRSFSGRVGPN